MSWKRIRGAAGVGVVALSFSVGWSAVARAEEPVVGDGADLLAQARELYREGAKSAREAQWERARLFYLSAWRAQHHWQIAGGLGHAEAQLDRHRDAAEHLSIFLRETRDVSGVDPRDTAILTRELERARAQVAAVTVIVEPAGADVLVDGSLVGKAPLSDPVYLDPGHHVVEARLDRERPASESRDLVPGMAAQVTLHLGPVASAPPQAPPAAVAPPLTAWPPPTWPAAPPSAPAAPRAAGPYKAIVVGGAVTSALLATAGVGLAIGSAVKASASHACERQPACDGASTPAARSAEFDQLQGQKVDLAGASVGVFLGAGVVAAGTVTYALVARRRAALPRAGFFVYPGGGAASASFAW